MGERKKGKKGPIYSGSVGKTGRTDFADEKQSVFHSALTLLTTYIPDLERYTERYTYRRYLGRYIHTKRAP